MIGEDPRHGHLNGELDTASHGELQEELAKPQLGQITALLQGLCNRTHTHTHTKIQFRLPTLTRFSFLTWPVRVKDGGFLTAEVEQVCVEEGFPVELLDVQDGGSL